MSLAVCRHSLARTSSIPVNKVGDCFSAPFPPQGYVVLASLVLWPPPTPFPRLATSPLGLLGSPLTTSCRRAGEGLPSSSHNCLHMPIPIHRRVLLRCNSKFFAHSLAFALGFGARLSLVPFGVKFTMRQDSRSVRYGLCACFPALSAGFRRTSAAGFPHRLPASYEARSLPRSDFHRLVVPSLARRASRLFQLICSTPPENRAYCKTQKTCGSASEHAGFSQMSAGRYAWQYSSKARVKSAAIISAERSSI